MSKRIFTREEIEKLSANDNVVKCSERSISYSREFKQRAVKQYQEEGKGSREIFHLAGFDLELIGRETPSRCLRRWNRTYRIKGLVGLQIETRGQAGGRRKAKDATERDKVKRLEAEVAYLKAENSFLAKLRAKRAE